LHEIYLLNPNEKGKIDLKGFPLAGFLAYYHVLF